MDKRVFILFIILTTLLLFVPPDVNENVSVGVYVYKGKYHYDYLHSKFFNESSGINDSFVVVITIESNVPVGVYFNYTKEELNGTVGMTNPDEFRTNVTEFHDVYNLVFLVFYLKDCEYSIIYDIV